MRRIQSEVDGDVMLSGSSDESGKLNRRLVGSKVLRKEDYRFLVGAGRYTDDISLPAQTYAFFVRSPHAHARIVSIDTRRALAAPGVLAVYTGEDLASAQIGGLPCAWCISGTTGEPMKEPPYPALARGKVRFAGERVCVVVGESLDQARDAAEQVEIIYEALGAVVDLAKAMRDGPAIHDVASDNTCYVWEVGDNGTVTSALGSAAHVTRLTLVNNRLIPNAIEPRCVNASYSRADDSYTIYTSSQNPHLERMLLAQVLGVSEHRLRIVAPDVGGGFGSKIPLFGEDVIAAWASSQLNRPVKWRADRFESFLSDPHGRDHVTTAELALDKNGKFLALNVHTIANMGAYLSTLASFVPSLLYGLMLAGQYSTPAIYCKVSAVFTNTAPVDAYRGAGRPEATYVIERLVETAAREMSMDPTELRRRNFIQSFPYKTPLGPTYDVGDFKATLRKAVELADVTGLSNRKEQSKRQGKLRGLGFSCYIEACGNSPSRVASQLGARIGQYESAEIRVYPTGSVTLFTGSHSHGQGHETTFAQLLADQLGIPFDAVDVVHGDTGKVLFGNGTRGSRSTAVGGTAVVNAARKVIAKGKRIAAHMLEASASDIDFVDGTFKVTGTDMSKSFREVAQAAHTPSIYPVEELEPGLDENAFYDPKNSTFPAGCYVCEVEIDPDTGTTSIDRFTAVNDFGKVINPMIVDGQVHGGLAQGIGQALFEGCQYDASGQLLTGSLMDYCVPRATDLPNFITDCCETACTSNPLGVKGCGEAGATGAPAAVMNAITDALNIKDLPMPATSSAVWLAALEEASRQPRPRWKG